MYQNGAAAPLSQVEPVRRATPDPASVADERLIEELSQLTAIIDPLPEDVEVVVRTMYSAATIRTVRPTSSGLD